MKNHASATRAPMLEFNLLLFAFVINFVWEMLQMPLFSFSPDASLAQINLACIQASAGDAVMIVISFWIVAASRRDRGWILRPSLGSMALFLLPGIIMTIAFEALATGPLDRWTYAAAMPTLPGLGTGLAPLAQWLILPPIIVFLVKRQIEPSR